MTMILKSLRSIGRIAQGINPVLRRILFLLVVYSLFTVMNPRFAGAESILSIVQGIAFVGIAAVSLTILITAGEFDISIGAVAALSAVTTGLLSTKYGKNIFLSIAIGLLVGIFVGTLNGIVILFGKVPSFIGTIAMLFIAKSIATYISEAKSIYNIPELYSGFQTSILQRNLSLILFFIVLVIGEFVLTKTTLGVKIAAIGSNQEAAKTSGIKVRKIKFGLFVCTGFGAALAGITALIHFNATVFTLGSGWELTAIAAIVLGGTSLFGGKGTIFGLLIGLFLMQTIASGMIAASIDPWWQTVITGAIVLVSLALEQIRKKENEKKLSDI